MSAFVQIEIMFEFIELLMAHAEQQENPPTIEPNKQYSESEKSRARKVIEWSSDIQSIEERRATHVEITLHNMKRRWVNRKFVREKRQILKVENSMKAKIAFPLTRIESTKTRNLNKNKNENALWRKQERGRPKSASEKSATQLNHLSSSFAILCSEWKTEETFAMKRKKINGENWISQCHWFFLQNFSLLIPSFIWKVNQWKFTKSEGKFEQYWMILMFCVCIQFNCGREQRRMKNIPTVMSINIFFASFTVHEFLFVQFALVEYLTLLMILLILFLIYCMS